MQRTSLPLGERELTPSCHTLHYHYRFHLAPMADTGFFFFFLGGGNDFYLALPITIPAITCQSCCAHEGETDSQQKPYIQYKVFAVSDRREFVREFTAGRTVKSLYPFSIVRESNPWSIKIDGLCMHAPGAWRCSHHFGGH